MFYVRSIPQLVRSRALIRPPHPLLPLDFKLVRPHLLLLLSDFQFSQTRYSATHTVDMSLHVYAKSFDFLQVHLVWFMLGGSLLFSQSHLESGLSEGGTTLSNVYFYCVFALYCLAAMNSADGFSSYGELQDFETASIIAAHGNSPGIALGDQNSSPSLPASGINPYAPSAYEVGLN